MLGMVREMKKKKHSIPEDMLTVFENIYHQHRDEIRFSPEWNDVFCQAMSKHLTQAQRFRLYETQGACNGTAANSERKIFALEHAHLALDERIALFAERFGRCKPVLNDDNTLTLSFKCSHGYYARVKEGKFSTPPSNVEGYFERCAGGRLYELQKALGIQLRIKSVDVSPLFEDAKNPVVFTFEIMEN